ncbi:MAG: NMD3-related protein [Candidatus Micrarchaeota archaeon]
MEKRMRKVCAKCGREEEHAEFIGAFCLSCAPEAASSTLPRRVSVDRCPRCGRLRRGIDYFEATPEELADIASTRLKGSAEVVGCRLSMHGDASRKIAPAELECTLAAEGKEFVKRYSFEFAFDGKLCETCRRVAAGYHEGILQLRGDPEKVERAAERLRGELGPDMVTKEKSEGKGVDLFIAERDAMMKLVMQLHRPYTATRKLKGVKKGKHQFITTVCVRY